MSDRPPIRRALISVHDKTGIVDFARALHEEFGVEIISTGGTARALSDAGIPVTLVETVTGFPEMLDGRVKTLHPRIHAAILADRDNPEHMRQLEQAGIEPIDMVVVNLYPFEKTVADPNCTFEQAIEMIDIGGPCLLRAAAKNHRHVVVVPDAAFYELVTDALKARSAMDLKSLRLELAKFSFVTTRKYDHRIWDYLSTETAVEGSVDLRTDQFGSSYFLAIFRDRLLTYGENPHQAAALYSGYEATDVGLLRDWPGLSNPSLSFNNYVDASAALELCRELTRAARKPRDVTSAGAGASTICFFIKHTNACGVGIAAPLEDSNDAVAAARIEAYRRAYLGDPNAAMGGILAVNFPVDAGFAAAVMETYTRFGKPLREAGPDGPPHPNPPGAFFVEVWIAPCFTDDAVAVIRGTYDLGGASPDTAAGETTLDAPAPKKDWGQRVRLLAVGDMAAEPDPNEMDLRKIAGGVLMQTPDRLGLNEEHWKVVTMRAPDEREMADLRLAWLVCKHTKSNAITLCRDGMLIGNGAGQMSRVMSCRIATWLARENGHMGEGREQGTGNREGSGIGDRGSGGEANTPQPQRSSPVAASDAFFPFRDGVDVLIDAGVTAIIQPGGSKRDEEVIAACDERGVAMIFTGTRHFRH